MVGIWKIDVKFNLSLNNEALKSAQSTKRHEKIEVSNEIRAISYFKLIQVFKIYKILG